MTRFSVFIAILALMPISALAQNLPPHTPGTICVILGNWCWAAPTGTPGQSCSCPTPSGWATGTLG